MEPGVLLERGPVEGCGLQVFADRLRGEALAEGPPTLYSYLSIPSAISLYIISFLLFCR